MNQLPIERRDFLADLGAGVGVAALATSVFAGGGVSPAAADAPRGRKSSSGLAELTFRPLPLGSIRPAGWLRRQLRLQADGLSGHLDEFWPDVGQSQWFGGKAEGWERAPYWLDGVDPAGLGPGRRGAPGQGQSATSTTSSPTSGRTAGTRPIRPMPTRKPYDLWAILLANKVLVQYHEATGDAAVLEAVVRNLKATLAALDRTPLFDWGKFRWFEGLIPVYYAYEQTGEPGCSTWPASCTPRASTTGRSIAGEDITSPTPRRGPVDVGRSTWSTRPWP